MNQLLDECKQISGLEQLRQMMERDQQAGLAETLDIRLVEIEAGRVVVESQPRPSRIQPGRSVHGGFIASMLDYACGYTVMSSQGPGQSFTTLELKILLPQGHQAQHRSGSRRRAHSLHRASRRLH